MPAAGRKFLETRIKDERAEQLRLRRAGRIEDAEQHGHMIDRLLEKYLQLGKRRAVARPRL